MEISKEVIQGCIKKDNKAQFELYKALYAPMLKVCRRYYANHEDALTAFHNGLLKVMANLKKYKYEKSFVNWSKVIMVNGIIDEIRKNKKRLELEKKYDYQEFQPLTDRVERNLVEKNMDWEYVEKLLLILPNASRIVFNMYVFEGYNHREISQAIGISEGTSKWHLSNARNIIKAHLPKELKANYQLD